MEHQKAKKKRRHSGRKQDYAVDARKQRRTPSQRRARRDLGRLSRMWNELTEDQRTAWRHRAGDVRSRVRMARSYLLDGQKFFSNINSVVALPGREPRTDPPPDPKFGPNPVGALQITGVGDPLAIKLGVRGSPTEEVTR